MTKLERVISFFIVGAVMCGFVYSYEIDENPRIPARHIKTDYTQFNGTLDSTDTDVQKALETLDAVINGSSVVIAINVTDPITSTGGHNPMLGLNTTEKTNWDSAYSASHTRQHAITTAADHTSTATSGKMLKADTNGLPVDATNTDTDVADAVTKKHAIGGDTTLGTQTEALDMGNYQINNLGAPTTIHDAVNLEYIQDSMGVNLNYWIEASNVMQTLYVGTPAFVTNATSQDAEEELTSLVWRSSVAQTPTPFVIKNGTEFIIHFNAKVSTGHAGTTYKTCKLRAKLYYADSDGTSNLTQIGAATSDSILSLTETAVLQELYGLVTTEVSVPSDKRLVIKLFSVCSGTPPKTNYPTVNVEYGDVHDHVSLMVTGAIFGNYLPLAGGTMNGDINMDSLYQIVSLQAPDASGQAVRTTASITEVALERTIVSAHTVNLDTRIIAGDSEVSITDTGTDGAIILKPDNATELTVDKAGVKVADLTATRIPVVGVSGLLADDSDFTFATDTLTATKIAQTTFTAFPLTPSAAPDADYEVANKKYVDDNISAGGGANTELSNLGVTELNADLLPGTDNDINLGIASLGMAQIFSSGGVRAASFYTVSTPTVIINKFSTDGTLAGDSNAALPTEQAVKTYIDTNSLAINYRTDVASFDKDNSLIKDNTYHDWDISAIVGVGQHLVVIGYDIFCDGPEHYMRIRPNGYTNDKVFAGFKSITGDVWTTGTAVIFTDSSGVLEVYFQTPGAWHEHFTVIAWI